MLMRARLVGGRVVVQNRPQATCRCERSEKHRIAQIIGSFSMYRRGNLQSLSILIAQKGGRVNQWSSSMVASLA